jgi:hypothetical protein
VDQLAGKAVAAGPVGHPRYRVVAGCDDRVVGHERSPGGLEAPATVVGPLDPAKLRAEADLEPVVIGVPLEVVDEVVA